jgi:hypothetical protein
MRRNQRIEARVEGIDVGQRGLHQLDAGMLTRADAARQRERVAGQDVGQADGRGTAEGGRVRQRTWRREQEMGE